MSFHHIFCAVDLTHEADAKAMLTEAGKLADTHDAKLSVITVIPDYGSSWVASFFRDGTLKEAVQAADAALHGLVKDTLPERQVQHITELGVAYEKVLEAVDTTGADLVLVGAHKPDLADRVLGPNAARIVRHAVVSVMVMRF